MARSVLGEHEPFLRCLHLTKCKIRYYGELWVCMFLLCGTLSGQTVERHPDRDQKKEDKNNYLPRSSGTWGEKTEQRHSSSLWRKEGERGVEGAQKRSEEERAQVMVLSCWCHRRIRAPLLSACHLHLTQYPLYSQYHASPFRSVFLSWCSDSPIQRTFFSPHQTAASDTVYIVPPVFSPSGVPSPYPLFCLHRFFPPSFSSPTWTLGLCFWLALCLLPIPGPSSSGVFPTAETLPQNHGLFRYSVRSHCRNRGLNLVPRSFLSLKSLPSLKVVLSTGPGTFEVPRRWKDCHWLSVFSVYFTSYPRHLSSIKEFPTVYIRTALVLWYGRWEERIWSLDRRALPKVLKLNNVMLTKTKDRYDNTYYVLMLTL